MQVESFPFSPSNSDKNCRVGEIYWTLFTTQDHHHNNGITAGQKRKADDSDSVPLLWPVQVVHIFSQSRKDLLHNLLYKSQNTTSSYIPSWSRINEKITKGTKEADLINTLIENYEKYTTEENFGANNEPTQDVKELFSNYRPGQTNITRHMIVTPLFEQFPTPLQDRMFSLWNNNNSNNNDEEQGDGKTKQPRVLFYRPEHTLLPYTMYSGDPSDWILYNSAIIKATYLTSSWATPVTKFDYDFNPIASLVGNDAWSVCDEYKKSTQAFVDSVRFGGEIICIGDLVRFGGGIGNSNATTTTTTGVGGSTTTNNNSNTLANSSSSSTLADDAIGGEPGNTVVEVVKSNPSTNVTTAASSDDAGCLLVEKIMYSVAIGANTPGAMFRQCNVTLFGSVFQRVKSPKRDVLYSFESKVDRKYPCVLEGQKGYTELLSQVGSSTRKAQVDRVWWWKHVGVRHIDLKRVYGKFHGHYPNLGPSNKFDVSEVRDWSGVGQVVEEEESLQDIVAKVSKEKTREDCLFSF